jgi:hypothetical protein
MDNKLFFCPNCYQRIHVESIQSGLFRCGVMKSTMVQIDPHLSEEECERLVSEDLIHGCGRPFRYEEGCLLFCDFFSSNNIQT